MILLLCFCAVSTIGFGLVLDMGVLDTLKLLLWVVFVDCIGVGLLISTLMWSVGGFILKNNIHSIQGFLINTEVVSFDLDCLIHFITTEFKGGLYCI